MSRYDDIINLPHHTSKTRTPMPMENRAAQFAPFAALSGHDEAIAEAARLTTPKEILSQDEMATLSQRLAYIVSHIGQAIECTYVHYVPDTLKEGGKYQTRTGIARKYDDHARLLTFADGTTLAIDNILDVMSTALDEQGV